LEKSWGRDWREAQYKIRVPERDIKEAPWFQILESKTYPKQVHLWAEQALRSIMLVVVKRPVYEKMLEYWLLGHTEPLPLLDYKHPVPLQFIASTIVSPRLSRDYKLRLKMCIMLMMGNFVIAKYFPAFAEWGFRDQEHEEFALRMNMLLEALSTEKVSAKITEVITKKRAKFVESVMPTIVGVKWKNSLKKPFPLDLVRTVKEYL